MYASRTGTRRNLDALRRHGWRLLVSPTGCLRNEGFPYALDNGAWTAYQRGSVFDADAFMRAVDLLGDKADWIVIPDKVGDSASTTQMLDHWWPRIAGAGLLLFALQDGMSAASVQPLLRPGMGLFLGGSTEFKEQTAESWGVFARSHSLYFHMGRVNTSRRILLATGAGCDSCDGTSASRFSVTVPKLTAAAKQQSIWSLGGT